MSEDEKDSLEKLGDLLQELSHIRINGRGNDKLLLIEIDSIESVMAQIESDNEDELEILREMFENCYRVGKIENVSENLHIVLSCMKDDFFIILECRLKFIVQIELFASAEETGNIEVSRSFESMVDYINGGNLCFDELIMVVNPQNEKKEISEEVRLNDPFQDEEVIYDRFVDRVCDYSDRRDWNTLRLVNSQFRKKIRMLSTERRKRKIIKYASRGRSWPEQELEELTNLQKDFCYIARGQGKLVKLMDRVMNYLDLKNKIKISQLAYEMRNGLLLSDIARMIYLKIPLERKGELPVKFVEMVYFAGKRKFSRYKLRGWRVIEDVLFSEDKLKPRLLSVVMSRLKIKC